ncbi:MAG: hypothetical protein ABI718_10965 [Acidobacteriota bacterium]
MKKLSPLAVTFILIFTAACASTSGMNSENKGSGMSARRTDATHYRLVSDPRTVREIVWSQPPLALHVKGTMTTAGFEPTGDVDGRGALCADGKDWVNLRDGSFHTSAESMTPGTPYLLGCKGRTGGFMPATKKVNS